LKSGPFAPLHNEAIHLVEAAGWQKYAFNAELGINGNMPRLGLCRVDLHFTDFYHY
jgi:hypothetical protein